MPENTFGPVFMAALVGGIVAVLVVVTRAAISSSTQQHIRRIFSGINAIAIAWGIAGLAVSCLVALAAAGLNSNQNLLAAMLMRPTELLLWPAAIGFAGGVSIWVIRRK